MSFNYRFEPPTNFDEPDDGFCEKCNFCKVYDYCHLMVDDDQSGFYESDQEMFDAGDFNE